MEQAEFYQFDIDVAQIAEVVRRGSVVESWLLDLAATAIVQSADLAQFAGRVSDSGEGPWTSIAAWRPQAAVPGHGPSEQFWYSAWPSGDKLEQRGGHSPRCAHHAKAEEARLRSFCVFSARLRRQGRRLRERR